MIFKSRMKKIEEEISEIKSCIKTYKVVTEFKRTEPMYDLRFEDALKLMLEGKTVESQFNGMHYKFSDGTFVAWSGSYNVWCVADMAGIIQLKLWRLIE